MTVMVVIYSIIALVNLGSAATPATFWKTTTKNEYFIEEELLTVAKTLRTFRLVRNFLKENWNDFKENIKNLIEKYGFVMA